MRAIQRLFGLGHHTNDEVQRSVRNYFLADERNDKDVELTSAFCQDKTRSQAADSYNPNNGK